MKHRRKIHILLVISGLCKMMAKKLAGNYSGFVFTMPLPGWSFVLNRFNRQVFLSEYISKGKPILKNALDVQSWSMPQQWHDDLEGLKEKTHDNLV